MTVRLVVLDVDGTLLHTGARITDRAAAHVRALVDDGLAVALASARPDMSLAVVARAIGRPLPVVSYNGALVTLADGTVAGEVGFTATPGLAAALAAFTRDGGAIDVYAADGRWLAFGDPAAIDREEHDTWCTATSRAPHASPGDLAGLAVRKVLCEGDEALLAPVQQAVAAVDGLNLTHSGMGLHDIWPAASGKGNALATLCRALGIGTGEVLAAGDSATDLPMLTLAGTSVGVRPGPAEVAAAATRMFDGPGSDALFAAVRELAGLPPRS